MSRGALLLAAVLGAGCGLATAVRAAQAPPRVVVDPSPPRASRPAALAPASVQPPNAAPGSNPPATARVPRALDPEQVPAGPGISSAPVGRVEGVAVIAVNDLARLLGATKFWRADVRRLVLRAGEHRLTLTGDNPFVLLDDKTVRLEHMVVIRSGEMQVPVELLAYLKPTAGWPRLAYDADARQVRVAPLAGFVGVPRLEIDGGLTVFVVPSERAEAAAVVGKSRARFRLRLAGGFAGVLPDSLPAHGLLRDVRVSPSPGGVTFELALDRSTVGWRLEREPAAGRVRLVFARAGQGYEPFAAEGAAGPRVMRTIVIDPGHGGGDVGVRVEGADEKNLTLELAKLVADELQRRAQVHTVLTRTDDRDVSPVARAELANSARADAMLSLHFETLPDARARGTLAWCAPASATAPAPDAAGLVALTPWRDVAIQRAVESRGLAESVTAALERRGFGPASVRERLPLAMVGVQPPGVLLECGTLSNAEERARLLAPGGLRSLAAAIAEGVLAWQRNE